MINLIPPDKYLPDRQWTLVDAVREIVEKVNELVGAWNKGTE